MYIHTYTCIYAYVNPPHRLEWAVERRVFALNRSRSRSGGGGGGSSSSNGLDRNGGVVVWQSPSLSPPPHQPEWAVEGKEGMFTSKVPCSY